MHCSELDHYVVSPALYVIDLPQRRAAAPIIRVG